MGLIDYADTIFAQADPELGTIQDDPRYSNLEPEKNDNNLTQIVRDYVLLAPLLHLFFLSIPRAGRW